MLRERSGRSLGYSIAFALLGVGLGTSTGQARPLVGDGSGKEEAASLDHQPGTYRVTFSTFHGTVSAHFPDDVSAGDTISGTVVGEPSGRSETEKSRNQAELTGYVIEIEPVMDDRKARTRPTALGVSAGTFTLGIPRPEAGARRAGGTCRVVLKDPRGTVSGRVELPVHPPALSAAEGRVGGPAGGFRLPKTGQQGRLAVIRGPFDGDLSSTTVEVGGQGARKIAESPRKSIFEIPTALSGPTELVVKETGVESRTPFRCVSVKLSAPKTHLLRGEQTSLTIEVGGLQGIREAVPLYVEAGGVVSAEGGNVQTIPIRPAEVRPDGTCRHTRTLTGERAGSFSVTATLFVPCLNEGETVLVDQAPQGGSGLWYAYVRLADGTVVKVWFEVKDRPALKPGDRIRITKCHTDGHGEVRIEGHERAEAPPPTAPQPPAGPTPPDKPAAGEPPPPGRETRPEPCKEGEERNRSQTQTREFEYVDAGSEISVRVYTDIDGAKAAARNMADLWKRAATAGDLLKRVLPGGVGQSVAGALLDYLDKGGQILEAVAGGPLARRAGEVQVDVMVTTTKATIEVYTVEVCRNGVWVTEMRCQETRSRGILRAYQKARKGDDEWEKVTEPSTPDLLSPKKVDEWARAFLAQQLRSKQAAEAEMLEFKRGCK